MIIAPSTTAQRFANVSETRDYPGLGTGLAAEVAHTCGSLTEGTFSLAKSVFDGQCVQKARMEETAKTQEAERKMRVER